MTSLTGFWVGSFAYPDCFEPVPFSAEIRDLAGQLTGITEEPHEWSIGEAHGTISGRRSGQHVQFTKVYIQQEHYPDPVYYQGTLDEDECELSGEWDIPGVWSGSFLMTRPKAERGKAAAEQAAEA